MSRFFATGSDSESDSASEEEQVPRAPATAFTVSIVVETNVFNIFLLTNIFSDVILLLK